MVEFEEVVIRLFGATLERQEELPGQDVHSHFERNFRARLMVCFFFFQAEDGIRDTSVTGVQTCALPIYIAFTWFSSDKNIATVEGGVEGSAEVTGVNPGFAQITARAVPFEKAQDGAATVRVTERFIIDSIRPLSLNYGDKLRFYGVRIQQLFGVSQGFGSLIPDVFSYTGNLEGIGAIDYWVPYPSTSGRPF